VTGSEAAYRTSEVAEDCADLLTLRKQWFPVADEAFDRDFTQWWADERHQRHAVVCHAGDEPVGMANGQVFTRMPAPGRPRAQWMYGANVYVVGAHRRRGVGRALMTELITWAREHGMVRVVLAPSEMSVPLYESLDFRPAHDLLRLDLGPEEAP
jgi:GNAT superfamily N-acetyltransferase